MNRRVLFPLLLLLVSCFAKNELCAQSFGPRTVRLASVNAQITVPSGAYLLQGDSAKVYLSQNGYPNPDVDAVVVSAVDGFSWNLRLKFFNTGNITLDDVNDELGDLQFAKEVSRQWNWENGQRELNGIPAQPFTRIIEQPSLDAERPMFDYAFEALSDTVFMIERRAILFARNGVLLASLTCQHAQFSDVKPISNLILTSVAFSPGDRYSDFNESTDQIATNGIGMVLFKIERQRSHTTLILIIVAVIFLAGAGGYRYYERTQRKKRKESLAKRRAAILATRRAMMKK